MLFKGRRQSSNVEDRRGMSTGRKVGVGGGIVTVIIALVVMLLGGDPREVLNMMESQQATTQVHGLRGQVSESKYNDQNVRLELQADFYAGIWAHHAQKMKNMLEAGDIEEAINAAQAVGDDRIQKQTQGYVVPDSFTHGTSAQRMTWFRKGFETGNVNSGDTFREEI